MIVLNDCLDELDDIDSQDAWYCAACKKQQKAPRYRDHGCIFETKGIQALGKQSEYDD